MTETSDPHADAESLALLETGLRKTMLSTSGAELDTALADLGWADMLSEMPDLAIPLVFRLLGETGSHASVLNDVMLETIGGLPGGTPPLPYAGGSWVVWERQSNTELTLGGLPLRRVPDGETMRLGEARRAVGWWLVGSARAMLTLARQHALDRVQFGKPIASFQAVRHRLAETLVAIEGAEATLGLPGTSGSPMELPLALELGDPASSLDPEDAHATTLGLSSMTSPPSSAPVADRSMRGGPWRRRSRAAWCGYPRRRARVASTATSGSPSGDRRF